MDGIKLLLAIAIPWLLGIAAVFAVPQRSARLDAPGETAWMLGVGAFVGAFALTLWMRILSFAGIQFGDASVGAPLAAAAAVLGVVGWRTVRHTVRGAFAGVVRRLAGEGLPRAQRAVWLVLLAWLTIRFVLLFAEVAWRPVYPWDTWIQWATKSRVWYEMRTIVPFVRTVEWFATPGAAWFDASPEYPATVPLLQVWMNISLGRWDDALMNAPWWMFGVGLTLAIYGWLRSEGFGPLAALAGSWAVNSLPLLNVHVALAGYADLPLAAYFTLGTLAALRYLRTRATGDAIIALVLLAALPTIKKPGLVWALTVVPGLLVAFVPRYAMRILGIGFVLSVLALLYLAQSSPVILGYRLHLDFAPAWSALFESYFLLGNWHLLWYAFVTAVLLARRDVFSAALAPFSAIVASGLFFLFIVFGFTNARAWVADLTTVNRATLHLAPLVAVWTLVVLRHWARALAARQPGPDPLPRAA